ncbi:MAG: helix-turn-helix domain-containing protein [Planctomycetes bacterium]|nr:helix-turn-helix domain-containing protein [Planctomycetota bacterium]
MVTIAEKINVVLAQRGLLKRDLARALGISPQTATDICKGRSAVTLPHLRSLVRFFGLRADFWLDDDRLEPGVADAVVPQLEARLRGLCDLGILQSDDPAGLVDRLIRFARGNQREFLRLFGELGASDQRLLGIAAAVDDPELQVPRHGLPAAGRRSFGESDAAALN